MTDDAPKYNFSREKRECASVKLFKSSARRKDWLVSLPLKSTFQVPLLCIFLHQGQSTLLMTGSSIISLLKCCLCRLTFLTFAKNIAKAGSRGQRCTPPPAPSRPSPIKVSASEPLTFVLKQSHNAKPIRPCE